MNEVKHDGRGVPERHKEAADLFEYGPAYKGPALARYNAVAYTDLPMPPKAVQVARKKMDEAANLVQDLDDAAYGVLDEYRAAPKQAERRARDAVAAGKAPESSAILDKRLDELARTYKDTLAHRKAVESHLKTLVDVYYSTVEDHYPAWRDTVSSELDKRAEPARIALSKALSEARAVYGLAMTVEAMDRPAQGREERPRVSALAGKELPEVFDIDGTRGKGGALRAASDESVSADMDAAARLATTWLKVSGRHQLGQGAIPEALTVPVKDLPAEDPMAKEIAREQAENEKRIREYLSARTVSGI